MADNTIHLNSSKVSEQEFDVLIQGLPSSEDDNDTVVRFVIMSSDVGCDLSFPCKRMTNSATKWIVKLPAFDKLLKQTTYKFRVEVIADGYHFIPADGEVLFVSTPIVDMSTTKKPKVKATLSSKESPSLSEAEITGMYAPTNSLLKPEFAPLQSKSQKSVEDEMTDEERLKPIPKFASSVTPGGGEQYSQSDGKDIVDDDMVPDEIVDDEEDTELEIAVANKSVYDPKKVAEGIVKDKMNIAPPKTKGFLFARSSEGKPTIKGLESTKTLKEQQEKAESVKKILSED